MDRYNFIDTDFIGFKFNDKHSADFGILRVSDGDRYEEILVPDLSDEAEEVPGGDGAYYVGETLKEKTFEINFVYDCLTEKGLRRLGKWLHPDSDLHELIFDERPYKKYWVKCSKAVMPKGLCFVENGQRVYKGEGTIEFTAYNPWAQEVNKDLSSNDYKNCNNKDEWAEASGLLAGFGNLGVDVFVDETSSSAIRKKAPIYNPGDKASDFILEFDYEVGGQNAYEFKEIEYRDNLGYYILTQDRKKEDKQYAINYDNFMHHIEYNSDRQEYYIANPDLYGYFDSSENYPLKFVMSNSGEIYDVYEYHSDGTEFSKNFSVVTDAELSDDKNYYIWSPFDTDFYSIYKLHKDSSLNKYYIINNSQEKEFGEIIGDDYGIYFIYRDTNVLIYEKLISEVSFYEIQDPSFSSLYFDECLWVNDGAGKDYQLCFQDGPFQFLNIEENSLPEKLFITTDLSNSVVDIGIKTNGNFLDNYYFQLTFPSTGTTNSSNWTELQKMVGAKSGHIIIDTSKQTIKWRTILDPSIPTYSSYTGVAGIITNGSLFKIPIDDIFDSDEEITFRDFIIEQSSGTWLEISEPELTYHYMYK